MKKFSELMKVASFFKGQGMHIPPLVIVSALELDRIHYKRINDAVDVFLHEVDQSGLSVFRRSGMEEEMVMDDLYRDIDEISILDATQEQEINARSAAIDMAAMYLAQINAAKYGRFLACSAVDQVGALYDQSRFAASQGLRDAEKRHHADIKLLIEELYGDVALYEAYQQYVPSLPFEIPGIER